MDWYRHVRLRNTYQVMIAISAAPPLTSRKHQPTVFSELPSLRGVRSWSR
jgi:hypothetical protein